MKSNLDNSDQDELEELEDDLLEDFREEEQKKQMQIHSAQLKNIGKIKQKRAEGHVDNSQG